MALSSLSAVLLADAVSGLCGGAAIATGLAFGAGYAVGRWASGGNYWGGGVNWGGNNINVNRPVNINNINAGGNNWNHNPDHRHGVRYNNNNVANKFNKGNNIRNGANNRMDFRGHNGQAALRPGGAGDRPARRWRRQRPGGGDRPGAGNRPGGGDRPGAGNRPGGGGERAGGVRAVVRAKPLRGRAAARVPAAVAAAATPSPAAAAAAAPWRRRHAATRAWARVAAVAARDGWRRRRWAMGGGGGGGGGGGRGGGGGGRRSDIALKHDITLLGHLDNGLGFYRFSYNGSDKAYVGVMAQEVQVVAPDAVIRGHDGYLRVFYDKLGLQFQTYNQWIASGARIPSGAAGSN